MKLFETQPNDSKRIRLLKNLARKNMELVKKISSSPITGGDEEFNQGSEAYNRKLIAAHKDYIKRFSEKDNQKDEPVQASISFEKLKPKKIKKRKSNVRSK